MPSRHKNPAVVCRPSPELHRRAKIAVAEVDSDINAHIIAFLHWLVGDTDELPDRPSVANEHLQQESRSPG
ncbi:hypothetical protein ACFYVL_12730 [Streptomyces sp. NPDC004111]|uniref:hypothetical protein n=1 Tax=unclassified Streptomyces TaxID=2593676 RepID=UPI0036936FDD